ncbi:AAA family ATPase [Fulvivirga ligni]|uniref:AAA family ATPase n=1 Tax=Fulvivirga ligni TaxID=2904246 RepID=UPI001F19D193|nr:ATP-binding protein [Fulvivirga ligni]UII20732.1 ATP-binding protein [Fulvivirga ligni]
MLIRVFSSNILSFDTEVEFSLIPGKGSVKSEHVIRSEGRDDIPVLKTGIIYGANASGKSNLIKVVSLIQSMATKSLESINKEIPVEFFKLRDKVGGYSKIEVEIKAGNNNYAYGVKFNKKVIVEEWLYQINKRTERKIFERKTAKKATTVEFENVKFKNSEDEQFAHFVARGTSENKTFLRECIDRNLNFISQVNDVFEWFDDKLKVFFPRTRFGGMEFHLESNKDLSKSMSKFLKYFNTGVSDLLKTEIDLEKDIKEIPKEAVNDLLADLEEGKRAIIGTSDNRTSFAFEKDKKGKTRAYKLVTTHLNKLGKDVVFEMDEESDGTRRLIDFIPMLVDITKNDSVYLIDEIDRSMHPILTKGIIEYFLNQLTKVKSQLIVTTHESNLLNLNLFRKDEIWFVEKNKHGSSKFYSLLEFKPRADKDIKKGYLNGRFGAIPFLSNPKDLSW